MLNGRYPPLETPLQDSTPGASRSQSFDRSDVPQRNHLQILGKRLVRLGAKCIERHSGNEAKAGIVDINRSSVRKVESKRNERIAVEFRSQCVWIHSVIIPINPTASSTAAAIPQPNDRHRRQEYGPEHPLCRIVAMTASHCRLYFLFGGGALSHGAIGFLERFILL